MSGNPLTGVGESVSARPYEHARQIETQTCEYGMLGLAHTKVRRDVGTEHAYEHNPTVAFFRNSVHPLPTSLEKPMKLFIRNSLLASAALIPLAGCQESAEPDNVATACEGGHAFSADDGEFCVLSAQALGLQEAPFSLDFVRSAAVLRTLAVPTGWDAFDAAGACQDAGFAYAAPRAGVLVCSDVATWNLATEAQILTFASGADDEEADAWLSACDAWCDSACSDDAGEDCVTSCAYGVATAAEDATAGDDDCAAAQAALYDCESESACDMTEGDPCDVQVSAVNAACWTCAADDDCAEGLACVDALCSPDASGPVCEASDDCNPGQVCVNGACEEDPCNLIDCMDNYTCEEGSCIPALACVTPATPAEWTPDAIDARFEASFPAAYGATPGAFTGDDSTGFQKRRADEAVVFNIEVGPGAAYTPGEYSALPDATTIGYDTQQLFANEDCIPGALYTTDGAGSLRDVEGLVVFQDPSTGLYHDVVFVNFSASENASVLAIAQTLTLR